MSAPAIHTKRWTRQEYDRMAEAGILDPDERVELLGGEILTPQKSPHSATIGLAHTALQHAFGRNHWIRIRLPLIIAPDPEPDPDLAVVPWPPRDYNRGVSSLGPAHCRSRRHNTLPRP
ncbi:MAG: Uma2 family endonuclease [Nitrospira sp.]|nr:Uma2 family endonuclease [Nitrospira sp.]MCP9475626.1 Uma2 family endonuclease [Nitrospira sp.]